MAAPKGNQYAVGNSGGAPPKYDLEKEAKELEEWSLREDATSLYIFTDPKDYLACELSGFAERSEVFAKALKKAKERIGLRRERGANSGTIKNNVWERYAPVYDTMLHAHEESDKDRQAERSSKSSPTTNVFLTTDKVINGNDNQSKDLVNDK